MSDTPLKQPRPAPQRPAPSTAPLIERLGIKPGQAVLILHAPEGYIDGLGDMPDGVTISTTAADAAYDWVQVFVQNKADIDAHTPTAIRALKAGGTLWISYPKKSSKSKTDINRDAGWETVVNAGWGGVKQISIDSTWSALWFRPEKDVKRKGNVR